MRVLLLILLILLTFITSSAMALDVNTIRIGQHPDKTRIVLELSSIEDFRAFTLDSPYRIVLDMPRVNWTISPSSNPKAGITNIRHGRLDGTLSRIVFDLNKPVRISAAFALPANSGKPNRLVIDYQDVSQSNFAQTKGQIFGTLNASQSEMAKTKPTYNGDNVPAPPAQKSQPQRKPIIVIDPGHGGQDPGAVVGKIYEKNITFALAQKLKRHLDKTGRYKVHLTRYNDSFIKLHERVRIAKKYEADLFVSLHADTIHKPHIRGASVYTLSEKASDAQTAKLAARENKADMIAGVDLNHEDADVASILIDLVQRDTMNQSNYFAEKLVKELQTNNIRVLENPHRSAGFAVLKAPDIPSVLIEAGFISNHQDAKLLNTDSYQEKIAKTIAEGITSYLSYINKTQKM